jgi:hypothetical protein
MKPLIIIYRFFEILFQAFAAFFKERLSNKNFRLRWVFYAYLLIILIFAFIYQTSYNIDHTSFVFAKDVHLSKLSSQIQEDSVLINNLETEAKLLNNIIHRFQRPSETKSDTLYSNFRYIFLRWGLKNCDLEMGINKLAFNQSNIGEIITHKIKLFKQDKDEPFFDHEVNIKATIEESKSPEVVGLKIAKKRLSENETELLSLKSSDYLRWNFFDFFYFSTITQATVGYGDMLPNSTYIRILVALQTLIGIFITIVMVAYSYDLYRRRREEE